MYAVQVPKLACVVMLLISCKPLAWHGGSCVVLCRQAVLSLSTLEDTAPLRSAHYLVGYHRDNRVWIIGFFELDLAQGFYNVIDNDLVKVLMDSKRSEVRRFCFIDVRR